MKRFLFIFTILLFVFSLTNQVSAQNKDGANKNAAQKPQMQSDQPLQIKKKPRADSSEYCRQQSGTTVLRVTFDKSEKITSIEVNKSSGCKDFDSNAISAAKRIKFVPASKNSEPITVTKLVEYTFTVY